MKYFVLLLAVFIVFGLAVLTANDKPEKITDVIDRKCNQSQYESFEDCRLRLEQEYIESQKVKL